MPESENTPSLSLGRETLVSFTSQLVMAATGFVGIMVFARVLGDTGLGAYRTVFAAAFFLTQFTNGVAGAIGKRVSEAETDPSEYFGFGLLFHAALTAVVALLYVVSGPFIASFFGSMELAAGVVFIVATLGLFNLASSTYAGLGKPGLSTWFDSLRSVLTLLLQVAFILLGFRAFGVVVGLALATLLTGALAVAATRVRPAVPSRETSDRIVSFARYSVPSSLVTSLYNSADIIFIRWFSGTGAVGFYSAANQLGMPAAMFAGSIQRALLVKSSGLSSKGEAVLSDLENAVSYSGLIGIPLLFGALAMPNALMVTVFGGDFSGGGTALVGLSIFHVLDAYKKAFDAVLSGTDRPQLTFRTNLIVACVHVVVAVVLGSRYGLLGVIAATVAAEALRLTQYQLYARQYFDGFVLPRPVLEQVASAMAMYVAVEAVLLRVAITGWVPLVAVVGLGVVVYFVALLGLSSHFRHTLYVTLWPVVADRFD